MLCLRTNEEVHFVKAVALLVFCISFVVELSLGLNNIKKKKNKI